MNDSILYFGILNIIYIINLQKESPPLSIDENPLSYSFLIDSIVMKFIKFNDDIYVIGLIENTYKLR